MVDRNNNTQDVNGFVITLTDGGRSFLLPTDLSEEIENARVNAGQAKAEEQRQRLEAAATAAKQVEPPSNTATDFNPSELDCIRLNTNDDLADADVLASKILKKAKTSLDGATAAFSKDLLTAVLLQVAYTEKVRTLKAIPEYIVDPGWDSSKQMLYSLWNSKSAFSQKEARLWHGRFVKRINVLSDERAESLVNRCHAHWQAALTCNVIKKSAKPRASIQIFNPDATDKAIEALGDIKDDRKAGGDRALENARMHDGFRSVPDTVKASAQLEKAKSQFENLIEPIDRLQVDLALAGAMPPEEFRITPILLLGDPGIGKTYLAMQLAQALGVGMEKISAGGAQGGFQLTGSHSSWTGSRPGSLFVLLAESKFATPIVVIDEVDKIHDSQYPVLPVLLDLFEPNTSARFKDEFFGMEFDASRIIFVLTANSVDGVPHPLLSRVETFNIPRPEPEQRLRIIKREAEQLRFKTKYQIELDECTSQTLATRTDLDLRKTTRLVREAFTRAMQSGDDIARLLVPKPVGRQPIGFCG